MKSTKIITALATIFAMTMCFAFGLVAPTHAFAAPTVDKLGYQDGAAYKNDFFAFQLQLPQNWQTIDANQNKELYEAGKNLVFADNENMQVLADAAQKRTLFLLTTMKHPVGTMRNTSFVITAEKSIGSQTPDPATALSSIKSVLESATLKSEVERDISYETISGHRFAVLGVRFPFGKHNLHQMFYVCVEKDHYLSFVMSFWTEDQFQELDQVMKSLVFSDRTK